MNFTIKNISKTKTGISITFFNLLSKYILLIRNGLGGLITTNCFLPNAFYLKEINWGIIAIEPRLQKLNYLDYMLIYMRLHELPA